ncbi:hypothetical protein CYMTET_45427 [Cymbomonas tetramitiformis]|uniref:Uncharacterized protein n=1 Tax=Cymbomonas tetramitiformis TaxID=36881 RepID=A0AAE0C011_9CHLO|nr:hypothetical protein CYMTET_45429 [Cymbomonas tetramitiformis]KAK3244985.1 hypothetical protein CYMTET_45427 [Cymbomonas tetramitiformis]
MSSGYADRDTDDESSSSKSKPKKVKQSKAKQKAVQASVQDVLAKVPKDVRKLDDVVDEDAAVESFEGV